MHLRNACAVQVMGLVLLSGAVAMWAFDEDAAVMEARKSQHSSDGDGALLLAEKPRERLDDGAAAEGGDRLSAARPAAAAPLSEAAPLVLASDAVVLDAA